MMNSAFIAVGAFLAALLLPGVLELIVLTLAALLPPRSFHGHAAPPTFRLAVVIPAHDEAPWIGRTVRSLLAARAACAARCEIVVIADNCSDATAAMAREAGARVVEREDAVARGKGFALRHALDLLRPEGFDAYAVVDADTVVDSNFLDAVTRRLAAGAAAVQCRYLVLNRRETLRTGLLSAAFLAFNGLRPLGRSRLGLSVGLFGNGFALSAATLAKVPYRAGSIVEDLEYHLDLVRAGIRVDFAHETAVRAEMPSGRAGAKTQRARWEGGRLRMLRDHARRLFGEALRGRWRMVEPLFDLLLPPIGYVVLCAAVELALPVPAARAFGLAVLGVVACHATAGLVLGGARKFEWASLLVAPAYVLSKLPGLRDVVKTSRRSAQWVRTDRVGARVRTAVARESSEGRKALSVIIVSYNTRDALRECLRAASEDCQGLSHEILVVDNASHDGSADMVEREFPGVRLMRSDRNLGFAAANNLAIGCAAGRLALLLNPDAVVRRGSIPPMVALMEGDPRIGACGGRIVNPAGVPQPSCRSFPSVIGDLLTLSGLSDRMPASRLFGSPSRTWADPSAPAAVDWLVGAFLMVRVSTLEKTGLLDERYFMYYEEVDLCRRIRESGSSVFYWPDAVVCHVGGASARTVKGGIVEHGSLVPWIKRSRLLYYRKNHGALSCWLAHLAECAWYAARALKNRMSNGPDARRKEADSLSKLAMCRGAWRDTHGGTASPAVPW